MTEEIICFPVSGEIPYQGFQNVDLQEYEEEAYTAGLDPDDICDLMVEEVLSVFHFDMAA